MDDGLKQRLIGAFVLLAIAVIFLPAFFDRERMQPVDKKTQIPAAPHIETNEIADTERTEVDVEAKPPETMFTPEDKKAEEKEESKDAVSAANDSKEKQQASSTNKTVESQETTKNNEKSIATSEAVTKDENGVPQGWVLQVASFKEQARATALLQKLNAAGYKAFTKTVKTPQGEMTRLYVGPKLNKNQLLKEKNNIEKQFKLSTIVTKFSP